MPEVTNDSDALLLATVPRNLNPSADKNLFLDADSYTFNVSPTGVGSPVQINFTSKTINIPVSTTFSVISGTATLTNVTSNSAVLTYANMVSDIVTVQAQIVYFGITYTALRVISKTKAGQPGANGSTGSSARVAYTLVNSSSLNSSPATSTVSGDSFPAVGTWGETNAWQATSPTGYVAGQSVWVSNGLYNPTDNTTTWNVPYLANLKVGSLSIITPNLGNITQGALNINNRFVVLADGTTTISSANSGERTVTTNSSIKVYDAAGTLRVVLGNLA